MAGLCVAACAGHESTFVAHVDPSRWPAHITRATDELARLHTNRRQHVDGPHLYALVTQVRDWLATEIPPLPDDVRLLLVQPSWLRPLDLARLLPTICEVYRSRWAITPVFTDRDESTQITLALARPPLSPDRVSILRAAAHARREPDEKLVDLALTAARRAGATVAVTRDRDVVLKFLRDAPREAVRVLIAHSPRANHITVGREPLLLPDLSDQSGPLELDLSICHGTPWARGCAPRNSFVSSCSSLLALHDLARVHAELWTGRLRCQKTTVGYLDGQFSYGEAFIQAAALACNLMNRETDAALDLLACSATSTHVDLDPTDPCHPYPRVSRRLARRVGRAFAAELRRPS